MPKQDSSLSNFIADALLYGRYVNLKWSKKDERIIRLYCPLKSKRHHTSQYEQIFNDYAGLKCRKNSDNRQRFLQAMKVSPCVHLLENMSSNEVKFYEFLGSGRSSVIAVDDNVAEFINSGEVMETEVQEMQEVQFPSTSISSLATGAAAMGTDGNDLSCVSSHLPGSAYNSFEDPIESTNYEDIPNDLQELFRRVLSPVPLVANQNGPTPLLTGGNTSPPGILENEGENNRPIGSSSTDDMMVPNIAEGRADLTDNAASTSFFDHNNLLRSTLSYNEVEDMPNQSNLGEEETSYCFIPSDYDPEKQLIQSCVAPIISSAAISEADFHQIDSAMVMPSMSGQSSKYGIAEVKKLDDNDEIAKDLNKKYVSTDDKERKSYWMMVLKPLQK